jgi:hypothetical protein
MRRLAVVVAASLVAVPGCTFGVRRDRQSLPTRSPGATVSVPDCRPSYAPVDELRPKITLSFSVDETHRVVTGTEEVVFTPDLPVTELVFRLWLNGPGPGANGGRIEVTDASLPMTFERAGATEGTQGTLLRLALPAEAPAGQPIEASLSFTMTLPDADVDRWGHTARTAWWASAHPMLAWVREVGWDTTPAVGILGETTVNEVASYRVEVDAPAGDTVLGVNIVEPMPGAADGGRRRWVTANPVARDVAVAVGPFHTRSDTVAGVQVDYAASAELVAASDVDRVLGPIRSLTESSMRHFVKAFGPYPYPSLTVVALEPIAGAGVEYPGLIFVGSRRYPVVVPHEVAHQWFYGLVGNDQGDHPWLDEAFASYAEALVYEESARRFRSVVREQGGDVGRPMAYWDEHEGSYGAVVYAKGAGALLTARDEAGPKEFDALLRCYIREHAYGVATPDDLRAAFAPAPVVVEILEAVGAL